MSYLFFEMIWLLTQIFVLIIFMAYLVDGNNLLGLKGTRQQLLRDLAKFSKAKKNRVTVVFDGMPEPHFPDGSSYQGVKIFYSRINSDADERIKEFVEKSKEKATLIVVTSDRALARYVRNCGAKTIERNEFRQKLSETELNLVEENFDQTINPNEMKDWLRYFGVDEKDEARLSKKQKPQPKLITKQPKKLL